MEYGRPGRKVVNIAVLVEGQTEMAFKEYLLKFLEKKLEGRMPKLRFFSYDGRIPKEDKLRRVVQNHLADGFDAVIALTDVYTGDRDFKDAKDAKKKMTRWVGSCESFYPHVALHDFEAWLLPFWPRIEELAKKKRKSPGPNPEKVNHDKPPSRHIKDLFESGNRKGRYSYKKVRDAKKILKDQNLEVAAAACSELKAFLNTILELSGGPVIE